MIRPNCHHCSLALSICNVVHFIFFYDDFEIFIHILNCKMSIFRNFFLFTEAINIKKSSWSPPDDQYGSREIFIRQYRHDIDLLPKFRPKRPSNLTPSEFSALNSLRARNDTVIKSADKGGALFVWKADLYREEAN